MFSKSKKKLLPSKAKRTSIDQIETRDPTTYDFEKTKSKNLGTKLVDNDNKLAGYEIGDPDTILIEYMEHKNAHKAKSRFQSIYSKRNKSRNHKKATDVKNNESVGCFFCVCKLFKTRDQQNTKLENIRPVRIKSRNAEKDISKTKRFDSKDAAIKNHTERCETNGMKIITVDIQQQEETIELELNERKVLEPQKQESEQRENTNVKVIDMERREESKELEPVETKGNEDEASKEEEKELVKFEVESNEEVITGENSLEVIIETKCAKEQTGEIQEELNTEPIVIYDFEDPPIKEDENELNLSKSHDINENPMETKEEEVDLSEAKENGQQANKLEEKEVERFEILDNLDIDQEDNKKEPDEVDLESGDVQDFEELAIKIDENEEVDQQSIETKEEKINIKPIEIHCTKVCNEVESKEINVNKHLPIKIDKKELTYQQEAQVIEESTEIELKEVDELEIKLIKTPKPDGLQTKRLTIDRIQVEATTGIEFIRAFETRASGDHKARYSTRIKTVNDLQKAREHVLSNLSQNMENNMESSELQVGIQTIHKHLDAIEQDLAKKDKYYGYYRKQLDDHEITLICLGNEIFNLENDRAALRDNSPYPHWLTIFDRSSQNNPHVGSEEDQRILDDMKNCPSKKHLTRKELTCAMIDKLIALRTAKLQQTIHLIETKNRAMKLSREQRAALQKRYETLLDGARRMGKRLAVKRAFGEEVDVGGDEIRRMLLETK
ncbi:hypothetical protein M8J75_014573 [Diaphorina citri]|nr:hypothetical protein M8J75_014573 [Diaphorina citri]